MTKNKALGIVLTIAFIGLGYAYVMKPDTVIPTVSDKVGAVTGPDSFFPCESHNGVTACFGRTPMAQATTTLCTIKSPAATSTLISFGLIISVGTSTSALIDIGEGTTPFATTTGLIVGAASVASGAQSSIYAQPLATSSLILAPNTYVNAITEAPGLGGYSYTGACSARFAQL